MRNPIFLIPSIFGETLTQNTVTLSLFLFLFLLFSYSVLIQEILNSVDMLLARLPLLPPHRPHLSLALIPALLILFLFRPLLLPPPPAALPLPLLPSFLFPLQFISFPFLYPILLFFFLQYINNLILLKSFS